MIDDKFIESIKLRIKELYSINVILVKPSASQYISEWISIWQQIPHASSVTEALAFFYSADKMWQNFISEFTGSFNVLTNTEIEVIYGEALATALESAICSLQNIKSDKKEEFGEEINAIVLHILPTIVIAFRNQNEIVDIYVIHRNIVNKVIDAFASSTFLSTCDQDFSLLLTDKFNKELTKIADIFCDISEDAVSEDFNNIKYQQEDNLVTMYNIIRNFNDASRAALPEWSITENIVVAEHMEFMRQGGEYPLKIEGAIAFLPPNVALGYFYDDYIKFSNYTNSAVRAANSIANLYNDKFMSKFGVSLKGYSDILADSLVTMTVEQRVKLCKSNSLIKLNYENFIDKLSNLFAEAIFSRYITTMHVENREWITNAKYCFVSYQESEIRHSIILRSILSSIFVWPERDNDVNVGGLYCKLPSLNR